MVYILIKILKYIGIGKGICNKEKSIVNIFKWRFFLIIDVDIVFF